MILVITYYIIHYQSMRWNINLVYDTHISTKSIQDLPDGIIVEE